MIVDLSRSAFLNSLATAPRGARILYHVGFLMADRTKNRRLNAMAHEAWAQYLSEQISLVQHRLGDRQYEYYAVKR